MGFERIVLLSHTYDARNALRTLPRLYKVYVKIIKKGVAKWKLCTSRGPCRGR